MTNRSWEQNTKPSGAKIQTSQDRVAARGGLATIQEVLKRWLKENRASKHACNDKLMESWRQAVGPEIAIHTRLAEFSRGELLVEVDSAPLLNELSTYFRKEILESLRRHEELKGIQRIRFRSGSF